MSLKNENKLYYINEIEDIVELNKTDTPEEIEKFIKNNYIHINDEWYYKKKDRLLKIIDDDVKKKEIIEKAHNVGHEGTEKTVRRIQQSYYWIGMWKNVKLWTSTCKKCQLCRPQPIPRNAVSNATPVERPFVRIGLDTVGPLPITKNGNEHLIVIVDYFTKWVEVKAVKSIKTKEIVQFLQETFARHGVPEIIVTDNGSSFRSEVTKMVLDLYGSWVKFVAPHHPESNGMVENRNREIGKLLKLLGNYNTDWDEILPSVLWALRTTKNSKTKFSSFELVYGRKDLWPVDIQFSDIEREENESELEYNVRRFVRHQRWISQAAKYSEWANEYWRKRINSEEILRSKYKVDDLVLIRLMNRAKLDPYFIGPFRVVAPSKYNTLVLENALTKELLNRNVHIKNVVPYKARVEE